jgi:hypothetical protein
LISSVKIAWLRDDARLSSVAPTERRAVAVLRKNKIAVSIILILSHKHNE